MSDVTITKHDTGGRRAGREVFYRATDTTGTIVAQHETLRGLRAMLAVMSAQSATSVAHRDEIAAMLLKRGA